MPKAARKDPLGRPVAAGRAPARPSRPGAGLPLSPARAPAGAPAPATVPPGVRTSCCPRFPGPDLLVPAHPCRMQTLALGHSMCASEGGAGAPRLGIPPCPVLTMLPPPLSLPPTRRAPVLGLQSSPRTPGAQAAPSRPRDRGWGVCSEQPPGIAPHGPRTSWGPRIEGGTASVSLLAPPPTGDAVGVCGVTGASERVSRVCRAPRHVLTAVPRFRLVLRWQSPGL